MPYISLFPLLANKLPATDRPLTRACPSRKCYTLFPDTHEPSKGHRCARRVSSGVSPPYRRHVSQTTILRTPVLSTSERCEQHDALRQALRRRASRRLQPVYRRKQPVHADAIHLFLI